MKQFDIESFVYDKFSDIISTTNSVGEREFRVDCINGCADKKLYINSKTGRAQCFKCGLKLRTVFNLIEAVTGASKAEIIKMIEEGSTFSATADRERFEQKILAKLFPVKASPSVCKMPIDAKPVIGNKSYIGERANKWLNGRGLSDEDIKFYNIQVCASGPYKNRVILPIYQGGQLVYFNARAIGNAELKVKNPEKGADFVGKSELVFNIDTAKEYRVGVLMEGFFDAVVTGPNAMAVMGKFVSEAQLYQIINAEFEELIIMFDADAHEHTLQAAETLSKFMIVKVVLLPESDPADLGRSAVWEYILAAPVYDWKMKVNMAL
jgi:hypothetical protein